MGKKFVFVLLFMFQIYGGFASHLVGGEFEIIHISGNTYLFRQIQYFDVITGNPGAKDTFVSASVFRKADDIYVMDVTMALVEEENVEYSNPSCDDSRIVTRRQVYEILIELDPTEFDDPGGYYMVWERCCRNITISNILNPDETGQTFYIEFPELIKDGERFINSTPQLFLPLSDYACINRFYYASFEGFDADGDSLVYSLVTPLNSTISLDQDPVPTPSPAPHSNVNWAPGYSVSSQVPGNDALKISSDGFLTVTPSTTGLFVFSVKVEEYRNNEKIGEVRRDFQLLVIDCPPQGSKPEIKVKAPGTDTYLKDLGIIDIDYGEETCFDVIVNDNDENENIRIKVLPVNFADTLDDSNLSIESGIIANADDTLKFSFCFPRCINNGEFNPAIVDIIVYDDQCPQALMDTLRIRANIGQPPNSEPEITAPASNIENRVFLEGGSFSLPFKGVDADNDSLSLQLIPIDFDFEEYGVSIDTLINEKGEIEYRMDWSTDCVNFPLGNKNEFEIMVVLEDFDECLKSNSDTAFYQISIELPPNNVPEISVNGWENDTTLNVRLEQLLTLDVRASDPDTGDEISIAAFPVGFSLEDLGLSFPKAVGTGNVQQDFLWQLFCGDVELEVQDTFMMHFIAEDNDRCKVNNADTFTLTIVMVPPLNNPPVITLNGEQDPDIFYFQTGQNIIFNVAASDPDLDQPDLELIGADSLSSALGVDFSLEQGVSLVNGEFTWAPQCEHLQPGFKDSTYTFTFSSTDNKCYVPASEELTVTIVVQDILEDYDFSPPNAFTPNVGDDINEYFHIPNLPLDRCEGKFEEIIIFNRWGKEVYRSKSRDFGWRDYESSTGVYYYTLMYSHRTFRGTINLIK